jgi:hypothetical protein
MMEVFTVASFHVQALFSINSKKLFYFWRLYNMILNILDTTWNIKEEGRRREIY